MPMKSKIGYGSKGDLSKALQEGTIDNGDIVFTEDTEEVAFIKPDNTPMWPKQRTSEEISVNGVNGLGIPNGGKIPAGKCLDEIVKCLFRKLYLQHTQNRPLQLQIMVELLLQQWRPELPLLRSLGATFNKNDAGALTKIEILKGADSVNEGAASPHDYNGEGFVIGDETIAYTAKATYGEGEIKNDNLGQPSPNGHIVAGNVTSSKYQIAGQRNLFYGTGVGTAPELTSDFIRGLQNKKLNPTQGYSFTMNVATGQQYAIIAYRDNLRDLNKVHYVEGNDPNLGKNFVKSTVQVADARGGDNGLAGYKCFVLQLSTPGKANMTLNVTI